MLRFNNINQNNILKHKRISIHLMLRFNNVYNRLEQNLQKNFNTSYVAVQLCLMQKLAKIVLNFNTSYVAVQLCGIVEIKYIQKISIHLMLRFNPLWLYILLFSSYQKSTEVTIFSIIFSNDKRCLGKNKKITWKDLKYQVFLFVLLFFNWKNFSICSL